MHKSSTKLAEETSSSKALRQLLEHIRHQLAPESIIKLFGFLKVLDMSDQSRLSIRKGDPALDSWYNAAVNHNTSIRKMEIGNMEEMLFFDLANSNQVKYPSGAANDWFYSSPVGDPPVVESVSTLC